MLWSDPSWRRCYSGLPPGSAYHAVVLNEHQLKRQMNEYVSYCHYNRNHMGLDKQTPADRNVAKG